MALRSLFETVEADDRTHRAFQPRPLNATLAAHVGTPRQLIRQIRYSWQWYINENANKGFPRMFWRTSSLAVFPIFPPLKKNLKLWISPDTRTGERSPSDQQRSILNIHPGVSIPATTHIIPPTCWITMEVRVDHL